MLVSNYFNFFSLGLVIILSACAQKSVVTVPEQTPLGQMAKTVCSYLATEDFKYSELFDSTFQTALPEAKFKTLLKQFTDEQGKCLRIEKMTLGNPNEVFYRTDKDRLVKVLLATDSTQQVINGLWLKGEVVAAQEAKLMARQWCAKMVKGARISYPVMFHQRFRDQVSLEQMTKITEGIVREYGNCRDIKFESFDGINGDFLSVHSKGQELKFFITLARENGVLKIAGLRTTGPVRPALSFKNKAQLLSYIEKQKGHYALYFGFDQQGPEIKFNEANKRSLGSVFKLYVLATLAAEIKSGNLKWEQTIPIKEGLKSLPSGNMQNLKSGTKVTLFELAKQMISISDNTATDHLIDFLGKHKIVAFMKKRGFEVGYAENRPFLTTYEMFQTRADFTPIMSHAYKNGSEKTRLNLLQKLPKTKRQELMTKLENWDQPRFIEEVEWFSTPAEICSLYFWLASNGAERVLEILGLNTPFVSSQAPSKWSYVGYKGGSEPGVIEMAYLLRDKKEQWSCLYLGVNDSQEARDQSQFFSLAQGVLNLLGEKE